MARRKVVLVIVEGPSDDAALGVMLNQIYEKDSVYVHIMHGDLTTRNGVTSQNIISKIGNIVRGYARSQHYTAKDFKQIIHIADTDGAYIPDDKIIEESDCNKILYEDDGIHTVNRQAIISRNQQKKENLNRLRGTGKIWKVPYKVYYMSCNLDHVLHNKRNSTEEDKEDDAYAFAKKYRRNLEGFVKLICKSEFSVGGEYKESWAYIEEGMNSIERHTNLGLCIEEEMGKDVYEI
ncbi:MAG: hypothetical protein KH828_10345 [Clostridiales bacterium]|nr:hypothetical protein [Clostridiales bacterium]